MTNEDYDSFRDSGSRREGRRESRQRTNVQKITSVESADQGGNGLFLGGLGLILLAGVVAIGYFAVNRETNIGVEPRAGGLDHWHAPYLLHNCGQDLPIALEFPSDAGLHTHGDGLLHIHPTQLGAGKNATLGTYFESGNGKLTDEEYTPMDSDFSEPMVEGVDCNGEPAILQVAVWADASDLEAEPTIVTENLADIRFEKRGQAFTIALLPEGAEIPPPPADRVARLGPADLEPVGDPTAEGSVTGDEEGSTEDSESGDAESEEPAAEDEESG